MDPWQGRNSQTFDGIKFLLIGLNPLFLNPLVDMMATSKALDSFLFSFFGINKALDSFLPLFFFSSFPGIFL